MLGVLLTTAVSARAARPRRPQSPRGAGSPPPAHAPAGASPLRARPITRGRSRTPRLPPIPRTADEHDPRSMAEPRNLVPWAGPLLAFGVLASPLPFVTPGYATEPMPGIRYRHSRDIVLMLALAAFVTPARFRAVCAAFPLSPFLVGVDVEPETSRQHRNLRAARRGAPDGDQRARPGDPGARPAGGRAGHPMTATPLDPDPRGPRWA